MPERVLLWVICFHVNKVPETGSKHLMGARNQRADLGARRQPPPPSRQYCTHTSGMHLIK